MTVAQRTEVEADIRETLGLVPSFFSRIPDELLEHEWAIFKRFELGETLIPNKYKELMESRCTRRPSAATAPSSAPRRPSYSVPPMRRSERLFTMPR